jgi:hypothetical protein
MTGLGPKAEGQGFESATRSGHWPPSSLRSNYENRVGCTFVGSLR